MSQSEPEASSASRNRLMRDLKGDACGQHIRSISYQAHDKIEIWLNNYQRITAVGPLQFDAGEAPGQEPIEHERPVHARAVEHIGCPIVEAGGNEDVVYLRFNTGATLRIPVDHDWLYPEVKKSSAGAQFDWGPWKTFFSLTGGSILYCLSALCVVYGIGEILAPVLAESFNLRDTLPCIGAVNIYEIALLAVLLLIVVWQNVTDDAISLVVIAALFLIGSGMVLTTVANDGPQVVLAIGGACFALGLAKLVALRQHIGVPIPPMAFGGFAIVLAWNFGAAALLALLVTRAGVAREHWMLAWLPVLAGGALILAESGRRACASPESDASAQPFLRRAPMCAIFAAIALAAAGVHEYVLAYVFDVPFGYGDFLPLLHIVLLLLLALSLILRKRPDYFELILAVAPLAVCLIAVLKGFVIAAPGFGLEILWHPAILLALTGSVACRLAVQRRVPYVLYIAGAYLVGILFTAGFQPGGHPRDLNWELAGGLLAIALFIIGLAKRNELLCSAVAAVASSVLCHLTWDGVRSMHAVAIGFGATGASWLAVAFIFGRKVSPITPNCGALFIAVYAIDFVRGDLAWHLPVAFVALPCLAFLLWWRIRQWAPSLILLAPLVYALIVAFKRLAAWRYVLLGFALLFGGAYASIRKARRI